MHQTRIQLKTSARENLLGHYSTVIAVLLITVLITALLSIPFSNMIEQGAYFGAMSRVVIGVLGFLIVILLAILLITGSFWVHLCLARGRNVSFIDMFYPFRNEPGRFLGLGVLFVVVGIACLIPGLLCMYLSSPTWSGWGTFAAEQPVLLLTGWIILAAGIVVAVVILGSWSMSIYLLMDHPGYRVTQAIRQSRQMMHRKRRRLFFLLLSFAGWLIFSILSLGLALLWVIPYLEQSMSCFYLDNQQ